MRHLVTLSCALLCVASVYAEASSKASDMYAQATTTLQQGDLKTAVKQFRMAAKLEPENSQYRDQALLVYRVSRLQKQLAKIEDNEKWLKSATALHHFYLKNDVSSQALKMAAAIHERQANADSAALLGRTQLEAKQNQEAADLLASLAEDKATAETHALQGIALARLGQNEAAEKELSAIKLDKDCSAMLANDVARLQALLGQAEPACASLTSCFQKTPPSQLVAAVASVNDCPDFASLKDADAFATALKTKSLVQESSCSGGSSCGSCASRGSCSSSASDESCSDDHKKAAPVEQ